MCKVSVVTVCYNEEKNISRTLNSVLSQTYSDIEYVIKDGCSRDRTNEIIDEFVKNNMQLHIKHIVKKDIGIYDAMNQAIDACNGNWIIFMNAGDTFASNIVLQKVFEKEELLDNDILYGCVIVRDFSGESLWVPNLDKLPYAMPFSHQACFMKREILEQKQFNVHYRIVADYELILRCYEEKYSFANLNETIAVFNLDGISSTAYIEKYREHNMVLRNHQLFNSNKKIVYPMGLAVAWLKGVLDTTLPRSIQILLRRVYKKWIKKYI